MQEAPRGLFAVCDAALKPRSPQLTLCSFCPACAETSFSNQIRPRLSGEHIWIEFQATESPCTGPVHRELWKVPWHICPRSGIALGGKKARVASQRMQHWVLSALMDYPILCMEQVPRCLFFAVCDTALKTSSPSSLCAVLPSL